MYEYGIINYNVCLYAFNPEFVRRIALFFGGSVRKFFSFRLFLLCTFIVFSLLSFSSCTQSIFRPAAETADRAMTEGISDTLDTPSDTDVFVPQVTDETSAQETTETLPPEPEIRSASFVGVGDIIIYYGNVRCQITGSPRRVHVQFCAALQECFRTHFFCGYRFRESGDSYVRRGI